MLYLSDQYFWETSKLHGCFLSRFWKVSKSLHVTCFTENHWNMWHRNFGDHYTSILRFISPVSLNLVRKNLKERWRILKNKRKQNEPKKNLASKVGFYLLILLCRTRSPAGSLLVHEVSQSVSWFGLKTLVEGHEKSSNWVSKVLVMENENEGVFLLTLW